MQQCDPSYDSNDPAGKRATRKDHHMGRDKKDLVTTQDQANAVADPFIQQVGPDWLQDLVIERLISLEDGQGFEGDFVGEGPPVDLTDPVTGEVRPCRTWRFRMSDKVTIRLLDSARLSSELPRLAPDGTVRLRVARLGYKATSRGRRVTDYLVGVVVTK